MDWGTGYQPAVDRIKTITKEHLLKHKVSRDIAKEWRDFYANELKRNPHNESARQNRAHATCDGLAEMSEDEHIDCQRVVIYVRVTNSQEYRIILEPWGTECFDIMNQTHPLRIEGTGPSDGALEIEYGENTITIYGWPGSTVNVYHGDTRLPL